MEKNIPLHLQDIIFGSSDSAISQQIAKHIREGKLKKIAPRIYTGKLTDSAEEIIKRNLFSILGKQYNGAVLSHRSAFEYRPTESGMLFLTYTYTKKIELPGVTLSFMAGPGPIEGDTKMFDLYISQQARAYLENMQVSRRPGADSKTLSLKQIEEKLEKIIQINGEQEINRLRDRAREISGALGMDAEFSKLNRLISALLAKRTHKGLASPAAKARALGAPFDIERTKIFESLFIDLRERPLIRRPDQNASDISFKNFAFFESYFSNYIEGTVFEIEEAKQIIATQQPLPARNADSHDVLGTYQIVSSRQEMHVTPRDNAQLLEILQYRHRILMSARPDKNPGLFKDRNNFAGSTTFVDYNLVRGTLIKGFEFYRVLEHPFARAVFIKFMISEVHPFLDGNGRLARIMMNAELVAAGESKIIIPAVFREDYLGSLRRLTRQGDTDTYIRVMAKAHLFSEQVFGDDRNEMETHLRACNAFSEPEENILKIIERL
jgi:Fic family protein